MMMTMTMAERHSSFRDRDARHETRCRRNLFEKGLFRRCKNFTAAKRIGTTGNPTPVRMPHAHPETFRQFIRYIYTGMVSISVI
jgi:hypothetical protein